MSLPKALIIGASGFIGGYLAQAARNRFEVVRGERSDAGSDAVRLDVADAASVADAFELVKPDVVVLAAAMSDIDRCEAEPQQAFAVNVRGAETVAKLCAKTRARLLFTSTAAVFDGRKHGYSEEDEICPLSVYGTTKAQAEMAVGAAVPDVVIVRFSLAIGFAKTAGTNSVLDSLCAKWKAGKAVPLSKCEFRSPVHALSLSTIILQMIADPGARGLYHVGACDSISRYDLALRFASHAGFADELVHPQSAPIPGRAPRGKDHFLLTEKLQRDFQVHIPSCEQEIARCFDGVA